jgi:hypothetical protein
MENKELRNKEKILRNLELELGEIVSKLKAQIDILEQADIEISKAGDQLDVADTIPGKITTAVRTNERQSVTRGW